MANRTTRSVLLVRHGQASFGKADYDQLSDKGKHQARLLGEDLGRRGWTPDRIVCGTLRRHRQTLAEIAVGAGWDHEMVLDERWNELDHMAIISGYKPAYKSMLVLKADMVRSLRPRAKFEAMFESAIRRWADGEADTDYPETFPAFCDRIDSALADALASDATKQLIVSSVGCIARLASRYAVPPEQSAGIDAWKRFSLTGANTGVTRLLDGPRGVELLTYNEIGHLDSEDLLTFH